MRTQGAVLKTGARDRRNALLLACFAFVIYNANMRSISAGDCVPARTLPFSVLAHRSLHLEPMLEAPRAGEPLPYWIIHSVRGARVSAYPIVTPLLVTPLYLPAAVILEALHWKEPFFHCGAEIMEKVSASVLACTSVGLFYLLLRRRLEPGKAILLAAGFAFGTNTWSTSSQALWQHGTAELLIVVALLCLTGEQTTRNAVLLGSVCALIAANRPPDAPLVAALGACGLFRARKKSPMLIFSFVLLTLPFLFYNWVTFRNLLGGYGVMMANAPKFFLRSSIPEALAGLLFSPAKGLFFFSPFLLFLAGLVRQPFRDRDDRTTAIFLATGVFLQLLLYSCTDWRAGSSYGPRFLVDMLPILVWLLVPVVAALRGRGIVAFAVAVLVSTGPQFIGSFCYPTGHSDNVIHPKGLGNIEMNVWSISDSPVVVEGRAGLAPMTFVQYLKRLVQ